MKYSYLTQILRYSLFMSALATSSLYAQESVSSNGEESDGIEKIIVKGNKFARTLQETTTSVAVLTADVMEKQNITDFSSALTQTANTYSNESGSVFSIRGINGFNVSGSGTSYLASIYMDGAPLPERLMQGGNFSTFDVNQVEVLRGPQSTLQGRNALAGAVIMTSNDATFDWGGLYRLQIGQLGQKEAGVALGGALVDDLLAFRFSAEHKNRDGQIYNETKNEYADFREDKTYRLKFLLAPTSMPEFYAQLSFTHVDNKFGAETIEIADDENPYDNRTAYFNDPRQSFAKGDIVTLEVNYDINDYLTLSSHTTTSDVQAGYIWDTDYINPIGSDYPDDTGGLLFYKNNPKTLTQELKLTFDYDTFSGVVGAYYYDDELTTSSEGQQSLLLGTLGLNSPFLQASYGLDEATADLVIGQYAAFDPAKVTESSGINRTIKSKAIFFDAVWNLSGQLDIYGGFRWDNEIQYFASESDYVINNVDAMPDPANYIGTALEGISPLVTGLNAYIFSLADAASQPSESGDSDYTRFLPKLGASYHWNQDITTSFTVQKGYRSGGVALNQGRASIHKFEPENTVNYELSFRSVWLDNHLLLNANAFFIDWTDQQVSVQLSSNNNDVETVNAGSSEVKGFEVDANYILTKEWSVYASLGFAKTEFTDFVVEIPTDGDPVVYDLTGRRFADAPEWTSNVGVTYEGNDGWFVNASANYADDAPTDVNPYTRYDEEYPGFDPYNDARFLINAKVGYEWDSVAVYLIGKNLTDTEYLTNASTRTPILGHQRTLSLALHGKF